MPACAATAVTVPSYLPVCAWPFASVMVTLETSRSLPCSHRWSEAFFRSTAIVTVPL